MMWTYFNISLYCGFVVFRWKWDVPVVDMIDG